MPLYQYATEDGKSVTLLRRIAERNDPVEIDGQPAERTLSMPAIHFHGVGFTRTPAILKDPIARGVNAQQGDVNWGHADPADYGSYDDGD